LNRSVQPASAFPRAQSWIGAALALTLAVGAGLVLAQLLMAPPAGEMRDLAAYLALSGVLTLAGGWLAVRALDRWVGLTIRAKTFMAAAIGHGVALLNVFIVAQLMFVSTSHDLKLLFALLGFSALTTLFFTMWVAATLTDRIDLVTGRIRALASGDLAGALPERPGGDEVARLVRDVNELARRLRDSDAARAALERERSDLTVAISHDLRTPLASVRAMVEALDDRVVSDAAEIARYFSLIRREVDHLSAMLDDLFELTRIDAGALRLDVQPLALQEVAADVVDAMQAQAKLRDIELELRIHGAPPDVAVDGSRIERAVANLLRNALEHTPAGGRVTVDVEHGDAGVLLRVSDTGSGIEPADMERIWERFYRAEKSRQRAPGATDGAGLGLAIVRGIVEAHGGAVGAESTAGAGTTFTISLPTGVPAVAR
jgi:signal transduction histidine kinase